LVVSTDYVSSLGVLAVLPAVLSVLAVWCSSPVVEIEHRLG